MRHALLTAELPGVGGRIKQELDDFEVEEIPAYEPCGSGAHLYLWIEKRDLGAEYFVRQVAQRLGTKPGEVGTAGMKDRKAVTRQWVSVPEQVEGRLNELEGDGLRLLRVSRHGNKLKPGHLRGNRFRVLIRGVVDAAPEMASPILDAVRSQGLPNFYGPQRFGHDGENLKLGMAQLRGERGPRLNPFLRKLTLSAVQSALFNDWLSRRMTDGLFRIVLDGDVLAKWPAGGMFTCIEPAVDQRRFDAREIVVGGPMFGRKMFAAAGAAAEREVAVLADAGLTRESFHGFGSLLEGTRRHHLVYVDDLTCAAEADGLRLKFSLPAGSYATVMLGELMKSPLEAPDG